MEDFHSFIPFTCSWLPRNRWARIWLLSHYNLSGLSSASWGFHNFGNYLFVICCVTACNRAGVSNQLTLASNAYFSTCLWPEAKTVRRIYWPRLMICPCVISSDCLFAATCSYALDRLLLVSLRSAAFSLYRRWLEQVKLTIIHIPRFLVWWDSGSILLTRR